MKYKKLLTLVFTTIMVSMSLTACGKDSGGSGETGIYETLVASDEVTEERESFEELIDDESIASEGTKTPKETKNSIETKNPVEIKDLETTFTPEPTKTPEVEKKSEIAKTPEVTKTSTPTHAPAITTTPTQLSTPIPESIRIAESTPQPTATETPTQAPEIPSAPTQEPIPTPVSEHNHEYVESVWYEATCSTTGYHNFVCKHCGAIGDGSGDIPMLSHDLVEVVVVEGDCRSPRVTEQHCNNCTYVSSRAEDYGYHADDHAWVTGTTKAWSDEAFAMVEVERTCCSVCGKDK